jgi:ammonia channel protein AmtB
VGSLLTGVFAENAVVTMSGDSPISGGWIDGNVKTVFSYLLNICLIFNQIFIF